MALRPGKRPPKGNGAPTPVTPPKPIVPRKPFANPANNGRDTRGVRTARDYDALLEQRLSVLKEQTAAYFAAGGKAGNDSTPKLKNPTKDQKFIDPGRIVRAVDRLVIDTARNRVGKLDLSSGFKRRENVLKEAVGIRDSLLGRKDIETVTGAANKLGKFGSLANIAKQLREGQRRSQLRRDSKVAESAAAQRNAIARRRNMQLTPGSRSELNIRAKSIFGSQRRGTLY